MPRKLTLKQDKFVTEYLKTANKSEAVRRAYGYTKKGMVRGMVSKLGDSGRVVSEIAERLKPILECPDELAEKVLKRLVDTYFTTQEPRNVNSIGRTLLEATGHLGGKPQTAVQINIGGQETDLSKMGLFDLSQLQEAVNKAMEDKMRNPEIIATFEELGGKVKTDDGRDGGEDYLV